MLNETFSKSSFLKCQFHTHSKGDPKDNINYTAKDLINKASKLKYDFLSITCHQKIIFSKALQKYARQKAIILLPGIELEINKKHILCINIDRDIYHVDSFEKLREYKTKNPDCLIIAPHPFFPGKISLKEDLINNIHLFDAIEISFAYTKYKNFNKKAAGTAVKFNKPLIATSDCHILDYLDLGYCLVEAKKDPKAIIKSIKENKLKNNTKPITSLKLLKFFLQIPLQNFTKKWFKV